MARRLIAVLMLLAPAGTLTAFESASRVAGSATSIQMRSDAAGVGTVADLLAQVSVGMSYREVKSQLAGYPIHFDGKRRPSGRVLVYRTTDGWLLYLHFDRSDTLGWMTQVPVR